MRLVVGKKLADSAVMMGRLFHGDIVRELLGFSLEHETGHG
jgi:hypothetical protein